MSEDGTMVYLVARGVLDAKANAEGEAALPGEPNLYLWREGSGIRFIATLSPEDRPDWASQDSQQSAAASPSGRYLAFVSSRPLTGYDNRDAASGERDEEAFLYDAQADELLCASCDPSGARPRGLVGVEETQIPVASDPNHLWGGRALAATLPEATRVTVSGGPSLYTPRYVHDDGRLFFNAADSLLGADANGEWDVYEYEPVGTGSCTASAAGAATARTAGGCVSLISSGTAEAEAAFLDASEGGDDVFFYTPAQLSVLDEDHVTDIYDARVDGEPARLAPRAECQGEACQPPALTPELRTPASAAFRGPGNLREAARGAGRCAAPARRAKRLSARARRLRRHAKAAARHSAKRRKAKRMSRKATRLAERARANSKRARRCRRRARRNSSR
jgi:hypothetical protein